MQQVPVKRRGAPPSIPGEACAVLGVIALLLALAMLPVAACGPGGETARDQAQAGADGPALLRMVTWKPNVPEAWDAIMERFHRENPGVRVVREIGPHSSTAFHDLLTQKLKNQSDDVDVFLMDVIWPPEFASAGWALALDDFLPPEEQGDFLAAGMAANTWQGKLYGLPLYIDTAALYYRADLLERHGFAPPATWQELARQARAIIAKEGGPGRMAGLAAQLKQYEGLVCNGLEYILSNNGAVLDADSGACLLGEPASLAAVELVRKGLMGAVIPRGALMYQEPESLALFVQGRAVFMRNWVYAWSIANDPAKSKVAGKVGVARLPRFPGGESRTTLGGWQVGVSAFSRQPELAWRLVKFLTSPPVQKMLAMEAGKAPARMSLYDDPEVLAAHPHLARMRDIFATAAPRPRTPVYPAVSHVLQVYLSRALAAPGEPLAPLAASACRQVEYYTGLARQADARTARMAGGEAQP